MATNEWAHGRGVGKAVQRQYQMAFEQALALAGQVPTWELRIAVTLARDIPQHTTGHERAFALAAQVVLRFRERGGRKGLDS